MELPTIKQTIFILATAYLTKRLIRKLMKMAKWDRKAIKIYEKNWKKDVVYLYQFPRSPHMPNLSPFCLKLETWLRANCIKYEVRPSWMQWSSKSLKPFIELNGESFADSQLIIRMLSRKFGKVEMDLNQSQMGVSRAVERLIEASFIHAVGSLKFVDYLPQLFSPEVMGLRRIPKFVTYIGNMLYMKPMIEEKLYAQGFGRFTREEQIEQARLDLQAVADVMGENKFILGNQPHAVDCVLFGHMATIYYLPFDNTLKTLMQNEFVGLVSHMERMKELYWSDWKDHLAA